MNTVVRVMLSGGPVMVPLAVTSFLIWLLVLWRFFDLRRHRFPREAEFAAITRRLSANQSFIEELEELNLRGLPLVICRRLALCRRDEREEALTAAVRQGYWQIARPHDVLQCLIQAAPLLGLLGTVEGMIEVFGAISLAGTADPRLLGAGIGHALLTTQLGLMVAIPALYCQRLLVRRERWLQHRLEETRLVLLQSIRAAAARA